MRGFDDSISQHPLDLGGHHEMFKYQWLWVVTIPEDDGRPRSLVVEFLSQQQRACANLHLPVCFPAWHFLSNLVSLFLPFAAGELFIPC